MKTQTVFAYIGAAVIVVGAMVMVWAPETYYRMGGAVQTAEKANAQVQQAQKLADATDVDRD